MPVRWFRRRIRRGIRVLRNRTEIRRGNHAVDYRYQPDCCRPGRSDHPRARGLRGLSWQAGHRAGRGLTDIQAASEGLLTPMSRNSATGWRFSCWCSSRSRRWPRWRLRLPPPDPAAALKEHQLRQRVGSADVVVSGRVTQVHLLVECPRRSERPAPAGAAPGAPPGADQRTRAALVRRGCRGRTVYKGANPGKTVVVRYPASTDVRWFRAPKLQPGQEGVFTLHAGELGTAAKGAGAAWPRRPRRGRQGFYGPPSRRLPAARGCRQGTGGPAGDGWLTPTEGAAIRNPDEGSGSMARRGEKAQAARDKDASARPAARRGQGGDCGRTGNGPARRPDACRC